MFNKDEVALVGLATLRISALRIFNRRSYNEFLRNCGAVEKMDISELEKEKLCNTYYAFYLIQMESLINESYQCKIFVKNGELILEKIQFANYDMDLLENLCAEEYLLKSKKKDDVIEIKISTRKKVDKKSSEKRKDMIGRRDIPNINYRKQLEIEEHYKPLEINDDEQDIERMINRTRR